MKEYTKPSIEFIDLRPEERLACCTNYSYSCQSWFNFWGWIGGCYVGKRNDNKKNNKNNKNNKGKKNNKQPASSSPS